MAAPRQTDPDTLIRGINQGYNLAWINPLGFHCLVFSIQGHLGCLYTRKLCWQFWIVVEEVLPVTIPNSYRFRDFGKICKPVVVYQLVKSTILSEYLAGMPSSKGALVWLQVIFSSIK